MDHSNQAGRIPNRSFALVAGVTILGYMFAGFLHMPGGAPPLQKLDLSAGLVGFVFGRINWHI
jgi:hypothetical protein